MGDSRRRSEELEAEEAALMGCEQRVRSMLDVESFVRQDVGSRSRSRSRSRSMMLVEWYVLPCF